MNKLNFQALLLALALIFQSCAPSLPEIQGQKDAVKSVPNDFPHFDEEDNQKGLPSAQIGWKSYFDDENLKALIAEALSNSQELNILQQQIYIAQNEVMARNGEYIPRVGLGGKIELEKVGEYTSKGASDKATELHQEVPHVPERLVNRSVGLYASWEVDIWGKLRNASKAAFFEYLSSVEGKKFMTTHLVSEIAHTYFELLAFDQQYLIVTEYIKILKEAQELVEAQQQAAKVTSLAVKRFEAEVLKNEATQFEIKQKIVETENLVNQLVGRFPQPVKRSKNLILDLTAKKVAHGIPSDLLQHRPDVKRAELELEAARLSVKSAKARFYPALSIEAGAGYESFNNHHLFISPVSVFYNAAANLTAPLLNRQGIKADYFSANNFQLEKLYEYEKTIIHAYTEVSNQLSKIVNLDQVLSLKKKQVAALGQSAEISGVLFKAARVDYVEALMTQRDSLEAQVELVEVKMEQLNSYVRLYQSLGGGWKE
jgi:outer membrane protein, multidrug efflux system